MNSIFKQDCATVPIVGVMHGWRFGCWPKVGNQYQFDNARLRCAKITDRLAFFTPDDYYELSSEIVDAYSPNLALLTIGWITNVIGEYIRGATLSTSIFSYGTFRSNFADDDGQLSAENLLYIRKYFRTGCTTDWVVDVMSQHPSEKGKYDCIVFTPDNQFDRVVYTKEEIAFHFRPLLVAPLSWFVDPSKSCATLAGAKLPGVGEVVVGSEVWANCVKEHEATIVVNRDDLVNYDDVTTLKIRIISISQSDFASSVVGHCDWGDFDLMYFHSFYPTEASATAAVEAARRSKKIPLSELPNLDCETLGRIAENPRLLDMER